MDKKLKKIILCVYFIVLVAAVVLWYMNGLKYTAAGIMFWGLTLFIIVLLRPGSTLQRMSFEDLWQRDLSSSLKNMFRIIPVLAVVTAVVILPMKMSPYWNGEIPAHRTQYEWITEAFLKGQLYFEYQPDEILKSLDNPYDPSERALAGANEYGDSAYYNGHYYMYFGVVPVLLVFMPYRLLVGHSLNAYHATQLFATGFVFGIFALFAMLSKRFFPKLSVGSYLVLTSSVTFLSIWTAVATPAMYCTAQVSALMFMVWSIFFFMRAVYITKGENGQIAGAFCGALCGALAFGCRPPVAMANLLVLPLLIIYLQNKKSISGDLILKLFVAALPYILVAIGLMWYNYARFDNPFEFGKSYQITVVDASKSPVFDLLKMKDGLLLYLFKREPLTDVFPYQGFGGTFVTFPILYAFVLTFLPRVYKVLRENKLHLFTISLFVTAVFICAQDVFWSPTFYERYRLDYQYLFGILMFIAIGVFCHTLFGKKKEAVQFLICLIGMVTIFECFVLWMIPGDANISYADPTLLEKIQKVLMLQG